MVISSFHLYFCSSLRDIISFWEMCYSNVLHNKGFSAVSCEIHTQVPWHSSARTDVFQEIEANRAAIGVTLV